VTPRYLLDTNMVSELIRNPGGQIARRIAEVGENKICTSIIVAAELRYGAEKKGSARLTARVEAVLDALDVMPLEAPAHRHYGVLRTQLEKAGRPSGANDLLIAAHALALGCTIVTANKTEFVHIAGLQVENWLN
jgi:tRNA(fMet)-specific endonuclease VapC